ncbi:MAG: hypothetical protein F9K43_00875 [Bauldia sp.]|nr:MAG: hypothetical protein F9K43_00875 [Bauldia sp.]
MNRPFLAHSLALVAALVALLVVSGLWILNLRAGPRPEGFTGGAMVVFLPAVLLAVTVFWLVVRAVLRVRWNALLVIGAVLVIAVLVTAAYCGPVACFVPGTNRLAGWFIEGGAVAIALAHHFVLNRFGGTHAAKT